MRMIFRNKKKILTLLLFFFWISLILAINTKISEIQFFGQSIIKSFNALRAIIPLGGTIIVILLSFFIFLKKKNLLQNYNSYFYLWTIYFLSQTLGLISNFELSFLYDYNLKSENFSNYIINQLAISEIFLIILGLGTICTFYLSYYFKVELEFLLKIIILILFFSSISIFAYFYIKNELISFLNLYKLINPDPLNTIFNQPTPRITGLSRMLAVVNLLAISIFILKNLKIKNKISLFIFITIFSNIIISSQSRGTLICYLVSIFFLIFFFTNKNIKQKIILVIILIMIPLITYNLSYIIKLKNYNENKIYNFDEQKYFLEQKYRIISTTDSGRISLWKEVLDKYNYRNLFGYGPQADRKFLSKIDDIGGFGTNVSNGFIYAFICGGYLGLVCYLIINLKNIINISRILKIKKENNVFYYALPATYIIFFSTRQIFENSFSLFSIDFLIVATSIFIIEKNLKKINI